MSEAKLKFRKELTNPIESFDEEVIVDNGREYHLARCKNIWKELDDEKIYDKGGSVRIDAEDVAEYGAEAFIGARVYRWVVVE